MSFDDRIKYVQEGTGQVFYLWYDDGASRWNISRFIAGPEGVESISRWPKRHEAQEALTRMDCKPTE